MPPSRRTQKNLDSILTFFGSPRFDYFSAGPKVIADEASSWNALHGRFDVARIDHGKVYSTDHGVYTNGADGFFSRMRRAEVGHHHHIAGPYLIRYAQEAAFREDHRRVDNGTQVEAVLALALACKPSVDFCGYWQRANKKA